MKDIEKLMVEVSSCFDNVKDVNELNDLRISYMGKKGKITELNSHIKDVSADKKKEFGMKVNELKKIFNDKYDEKKNAFDMEALNKKLDSERIDITLPSTKVNIGSPNILEKLIEEVEEVFMSMGYDVVDGPEIEEDKYNFEMLNIPKGHPARDAQDTFYIKDDEILLRSQTSPVQARVMLSLEGKEPVRMICPGKTYRRDDDDATHSHQFMQVEGLVLGKDISLADLKGTLHEVAKKVFGDERTIRLRPSFFPFTEPSVEVDVSCFKCNGKGCPICKNSGWIEVLGAGMVHPDVLTMSGYDPKIYQGFAFGTGLDRMAMFKYNIPDIRTIYGNDIRFIEQFDRKDED
jgi:phenylalanyl-tRNA synthetase alpha chain